MDQKEKGLSTLLNHPPRVKLDERNPAIIAPIYQASKFVLTDEIGYGDQFIYTRVSNPTLRELELTLSQMQGTDDGIVFGSGVAAITNTLLGLLEGGDHVLFFREIYRPARIFLNGLKKFGVTSSMIPISEIDSLDKYVVQGKTKLLYFESPTNPNLEVADIKKLRKFCDHHKILLVMDNTFAGPHQHHDFGIDLYIHSLTKFVNGHGDVMAGAVLGKKDLIQKIRPTAIALGATLDPHAAFLIQRGLRTYELRYNKQVESAKGLVKYLRENKNVKKVYFPEGELASSQQVHPGAVVSFELDSSVGTAKEFCHKMKLAVVAVSVGSAETLVAPTELFFGDDLSVKDRQEMGLNPHSVRVSLGLEDLKDIIADFDQALK